MRTVFVLVGVAVLVVLTYFTTGATTVVPQGIPIDALHDGKPHPEIHLIGPLPDWIPLPESGTVIAAGLYAPQPPYGAAATVTLIVEGSEADFTAAYGRQLEQAGFSVRRIPTAFSVLLFALADVQFEADERVGGHVVYITMRHSWAARFAQLTFWNPPAPHL